MRQCIFVIGTRAQLVKVAPVLNLAEDSGLEHVVWFTGQHDESIDDLIRDFSIRSTFVRPKNRKERSSILRLLTWFPGTFLDCRRFVKRIAESGSSAPLVIVHGDTLSTWIGAAAGRMAGSRIVHLESGLSSGTVTDPFPEELLRRLTFQLTDYALCPNDDAFERMRTGYRCEAVHTGENTLIDCVRSVIENVASPETAGHRGHFVVSIHRFQNIYRASALQRIVDEVVSLATVGPVKFILHPPTELRLRKYGLFDQLAASKDIELLPRMPYTEFLSLLAEARGVISDGGSNQEELSYLGVPTILFRGRSERPDGLGKNAVLYGPEMPQLSDYVRSGKLDALRKPTRLDTDIQPTRISVDAIQRWASWLDEADRDPLSCP